MKTRKTWITFLMAFVCAGALMAKDIRVVIFKVDQMECANCERKVQKNMKFEKGVTKLVTELKSKTVTITYDADKTSVEQLRDGFRKFNYQASVMNHQKDADMAVKDSKQALKDAKKSEKEAKAAIKESKEQVKKAREEEKQTKQAVKDAKEAAKDAKAAAKEAKQKAKERPE